MSETPNNGDDLSIRAHKYQLAHKRCSSVLGSTNAESSTKSKMPLLNTILVQKASVGHEGHSSTFSNIGVSYRSRLDQGISYRSKI